MNRIVKKISSLIMATVMISNINSVFVSADELNGLTTNPNYFSTSVGDISTYDNTIPTNVWNLSSSGMYNFNGSANGQASLYTNYLFTGVNTLAISVKNNHKSNALKVKVCQRINVGDYSISKTIESFTVYSGNTVSRSVKVDSSKRYYLEFSSPSNFNGYIA